MFIFYTHWEHQKTRCFVTISDGMKMEDSLKNNLIQWFDLKQILTNSK